MLARAVWGRGIGTAAALAFGFGIGEWLRGFLFTGFPWNSLGMTIMPAAPFMQIASVFGIVGMNALAVFVFALPGNICDHQGQSPWSDPCRSAGCSSVGLWFYHAERRCTQGRYCH